MTFSSLAFLFIFFPIVFLLYFVCNNNLVRNVLLVIASFLFYAFGEPLAVFVMLISICINYVLGLVCGQVAFGKNDKENDGNILEDSKTKADENADEDENQKADTTTDSVKAVEVEINNNNDSYATSKTEIYRKIALITAIVMNIGLLFVFKYADFFLTSIGLKAYRLNIALPIGISFYTFQGLSYVIDVYRDKKCVQKNFLSVMLYISFFPQLIAGPIVKYHDISSQLDKREFNADRISSGIQRFIFGLGKKVLIAGPMGLMVDKIFALDIAGIGALSAWIAAISYMFQIYFDFSGYSDMAIGLGCIFGFDFKENFNKPYSAGSVQNFWRRWHISLSTWFKEYVYIPLGGNRKGQARTYVNKFIVFILTGLWHGANWTFVCWGLMHGMMLIIEDLVKRVCAKWQEKVASWITVILRVLGHIYTLFFVMIAFVIFRADSILIGVDMIRKLFAAGGSDVIAMSLATPLYLVAFVLAVIFSTSLIDKLVVKINVQVMRILSLVVYIASIIMLVSGGYNPFIYFRF